VRPGAGSAAASAATGSDGRADAATAAATGSASPRLTAIRSGPKDSILVDRPAGLTAIDLNEAREAKAARALGYSCP